MKIVSIYKIMESEHQMYILISLKGKHTIYALMLETSFWWMSKSNQSLFNHSSKLEWVAFGHNLSIRMHAINDQPFGDGRELIYGKGEGFRVQ